MSRFQKACADVKRKNLEGSPPRPPALGGEQAEWRTPVPLAGCSKPYDQGFADGCSESQRLNEPTVAQLQAEVELLTVQAENDTEANTAIRAERDHYKAEVERLEGELDDSGEMFTMQVRVVQGLHADIDKLKARNAELEGLLRELKGSGYGLPPDMQERIDAALAGGKEHE